MCSRACRRLCPINVSQLRNSVKIAAVVGHYRCGQLECDAGDSQIHFADVELHCDERIEASQRCFGLREDGEYSNIVRFKSC